MRALVLLAALVLVAASAACVTDLSQDELDEAMFRALQNGDPDAAARFLELGADVNRRFSSRDGQTTLIAAAGTPSAVRFLLEHGADVALADDAGRDALMAAAERGDAESVHLLLAAGAEPGRRDAAGRSAADLARAAGHDDVARLLDPDAP